MAKHGCTELPTLEDRFWSHVDKTGDCWLWTAAVNNKGYGTYGGGNSGQQRGYAHRRSYELLVGSIPEGHGLDHLFVSCPKRCVTPWHLRPATQGQNMENQDAEGRGGATGFRNVYFDARRDIWYVQVKKQGVKHHGGTHRVLEDAVVAAKELRNTLFTHNDVDRTS